MEADLTDKDSLIRAIQGCSYIVHVASPIAGAGKISKTVLTDTAKFGMKVILEAAVINKVKRIVVTLSANTMIGSCWKADNIYSEQDFAPIEQCIDPYTIGKIA